ncbi:MAG: GNAT family N-acetyltransferase [Meiothermus sp.]|nr:GNAT family N-acetyltransferase [Meiothermus sp.]
MGDTITVREATEEDVPALTEIFNDAILNTTAVYFYEPVTEENRLEWLRTKHRDGWPVFVADEGRGALGFSTFGPFRPWPAYLHSAEHSVYVHPERRGQGIGRLLIPPLLESARGLNLHTLLAGIDASNLASQKLHRHFGFSPVAHFKQVGFKFGRWLDLVFMQKMLDGRSEQ